MAVFPSTRAACTGCKSCSTRLITGSLPRQRLPSLRLGLVPFTYWCVRAPVCRSPPIGAPSSTSSSVPRRDAHHARLCGLRGLSMHGNRHRVTRRPPGMSPWRLPDHPSRPAPCRTDPPNAPKAAVGAVEAGPRGSERSVPQRGHDADGRKREGAERGVGHGDGCPVGRHAASLATEEAPVAVRRQPFNDRPVGWREPEVGAGIGDVGEAPGVNRNGGTPSAEQRPVRHWQRRPAGNPVRLTRRRLQEGAVEGHARQGVELLRADRHHRLRATDGARIAHEQRRTARDLELPGGAGDRDERAVSQRRLGRSGGAVQIVAVDVERACAVAFEVITRVLMQPLSGRPSPRPAGLRPCPRARRSSPPPTRRPAR